MYIIRKRISISTTYIENWRQRKAHEANGIDLHKYILLKNAEVRNRNSYQISLKGMSQYRYTPHLSRIYQKMINEKFCPKNVIGVPGNLLAISTQFLPN